MSKNVGNSGELPLGWEDRSCVSWLRGQCLLRAGINPLLWLKADGQGPQAAWQRLCPVAVLAGSLGLAWAEREPRAGRIELAGAVPCCLPAVGICFPILCVHM